MNRLDAAYTALTPNRLRTSLPLATVILYQLLPVAVDPAQVVRQLPPETLSTATTLIPLDRVAIFVELVYGRDRSTTPSHLVANVLSASAGAGLAASNAVSDERERDDEEQERQGCTAAAGRMADGKCGARYERGHGTSLDEGPSVAVPGPDDLWPHGASTYQSDGARCSCAPSTDRSSRAPRRPPG